MKSHFVRHPFYTLMVLLIFTASCKGQTKTTTPTDPNAIPSFLPEMNPPLVDTYFAHTKDTFSSQGPQSITRNILEDRNGTFWLASWSGIISYDGKQFTNHTLKDDLIKFHVFSVLEERSGNLWFGTIRGGVYKYDGKSFTLFTTADGLPDNIIGCMMQDKAGNIWFGTDIGVSRYDGKKFTNFSTEDGLSGNSVNAIMQDKSGKIWFGTRGGEQSDACYYDGKAFTLFRKEDGTRFSNVRSIIEDKEGFIWIGGQDGLCRFDPYASTKAGGKSNEFSTKDFIGYILEDKKGNIWLSKGVEGSADMTLTMFDGKSFTEIRRDRQIFGIIEDSTGKIWFGSIDGAYRYDPQ